MQAQKRNSFYILKGGGSTMKGFKRHSRLLYILIFVSLLLAGCRNQSDRSRSARYRTTDDVLQRATEIIRTTLDDPQTLKECDGQLELKEAFLDPLFGVAADYKAWQNYRLKYEAKLDAVGMLERMGLEQRTSAEPLSTPAILETWLRQVEIAESPFELMNRALEAADIPRPEGVSLLEEGDAIVAVDAACREAHRILDEEMLGALGPDERALLSFLVRYNTVTGGTYQPVALEAPQYYWLGPMTPQADPGWIFLPGAKRTPLGVEVPDGLPSMASIFYFYRSLAGTDAPINRNYPEMIERFWGSPQTEFTGLRVDLAAAARAFAIVAPLLERDFLKRLERESHRAAMSAHGPVAGVEGEVLLYQKTEYGDMIIGGSGANRYTSTQASVIIDVGGNDIYESEYDLNRLGQYPLRIVIDLHGDDTYSHRQAVGPGAGVFGLGVLLDQEGNDLYVQGVEPSRGWVRQALLSNDSFESGIRWVDTARVYGGDLPASLDCGFSFGASFFGIGLHIDRAGNDTYLVDKWALGAASAPGVGVLADESGDDWYIAALQSMGTGFNKGVGILRDSGAGADRYQCWGVYRSKYTDEGTNAGYAGFGIGVGSGWRITGAGNMPGRQCFIGGIGLVSDIGGDDIFIGSTFGLGSGFMAGIGMLVDGYGNDTYVEMKGEEDHSGIAEGNHNGTGFLLDRAGDDFYSGGSNCGGAWDLGIGYFIDVAGDDTYTDSWKLGFKPGAANEGSLGVFLDGGGLDTFSDFTTDWANSSVFEPQNPLASGNFSFVLLLGPERDRLPAALEENVRGPVTLTSVSYGEEEDGKQYPRGIGLVLIEAARR
jgi:hypothetical protein